MSYHKLSTYLLSMVILTSALIFTSCEEHVLRVHYHRYDGNYDNWTLWTWLDDTQKEIKPVAFDKYGAIFEINTNEFPPMGWISMLPKYKEWENNDDPNRSWVRTMPMEIWILQGVSDVYTSQPSTDPAIRKAFIDSADSITIVLTHPVKLSELQVLKPYLILNNGQDIKITEVKLADSEKQATILGFKTDKLIQMNDLPGHVEMNGFLSCKLEFRGYIDSNKFISDEPLGVDYSPALTTFTVYAPTAEEVILNVYEQPDGGKAQKINLQHKSSGIWHTQIEQDVKGKYYTYTVQHYDRKHRSLDEVIDPYARAVTKYNGRGIIVNDKTEVAGRPQFSFKDAVIYEIHVRDFSISEDSGIKNRGKFLGFTESATRLNNTEISTGIDHLVELGVNTVQLLPVQDFEFDPEKSEYFWGYMPVNFNAPMNWYATSRTDDSAVREFKQLVSALHERGIKVTMDVVYNHTSEGNPLMRYNFNGFVPNFYYRQRDDGSYWNGSGCGNEVRSEHPMVRRFIVESIKYWLEEYKVDGFRFDLMGLHDMETMEAIVQEAKKIDPNIFIYGEPWTAGETPIEPIIKGTQKGKAFSVFNDHFRDAIKGPWYNTDPGYLQKGLNVEAIKKGVMGSIDDFAQKPDESINYVAVHDGRTFWDQLRASTADDSTITKEQLELMNKLGAAIIFTSQGVPFIHGGQEMLRTKFGSHNSYNQPDKINKIRWKWKQKHQNIYQYYRGLIALRRSHPMFRQNDPQNIRQNLKFFEEDNLSKNVVAYQLKRGNSGDKWKKVVVVFNPNRNAEKVNIPAGKWMVVVNQKNAGLKILQTISGGEIKVPAISALVAYQQ
jgi:pullulanase